MLLKLNSSYNSMTLFCHKQKGSLIKIVFHVERKTDFRTIWEQLAKSGVLSYWWSSFLTPCFGKGRNQIYISFGRQQNLDSIEFRHRNHDTQCNGLWQFWHKYLDLIGLWHWICTLPTGGLDETANIVWAHRWFGSALNTIAFLSPILGSFSVPSETHRRRSTNMSDFLNSFTLFGASTLIQPWTGAAVML